MPVVPVLILLTFEPADDRVGHRREDDLNGDLERPVEGDDLHHRPRLPGPEERNRIEEGAVDELAHRSRADRGGPEMTPLGPDLQLCHDIAVHEVAAETELTSLPVCAIALGHKNEHLVFAYGFRGSTGKLFGPAPKEEEP